MAAGSGWLRVAPLTRLSRGESVRLDVDGHDIALVRLPDGDVVAIDDACLHMGASLAGGRVEGQVVECPEHCWRYDLRSGARVDREGSPLRTHAVRIEDDVIYLADPHHLP